MPQLFLFGDSITWGIGDPDGGGWAKRLQTVIARYQAAHPEFCCPVYNLGISGDTSAGVANRLTLETQARLDSNEESIILIAIGINDSIINLQDSNDVVTEAMYAENLNLILNQARKFSKRIGFIGLTPVDDSAVDPLPWDSGKAYRLERVESFNSTCENFCLRNALPFLSIRDSWIKTKYQELLSDGLHPNAAGYERMFQAVKSFLFDKELLVEPL